MKEKNILICIKNLFKKWNRTNRLTGKADATELMTTKKIFFALRTKKCVDQFK